jgi:hypothetical protein
MSNVVLMTIIIRHLMRDAMPSPPVALNCIHMPDPDSKGRLSVRLKGILDHTGSWARILQDGRLELEFYDYGPSAQDAFGNDVAWMYRIETSQKPRLFALLAEKTGTAVNDDQTLLDALAGNFKDAWAVKDWLKEKGVPYEEEFDSWA